MSRKVAPSSANGSNTDGTDRDQSSRKPEDQSALGLPEPKAASQGAATVIDLSSGAGEVSLDHLGPIVVNRDGTVGRVNNWSEMTEHERKATLELLKKRNMLRRQDLERGNQ